MCRLSIIVGFIFLLTHPNYGQDQSISWATYLGGTAGDNVSSLAVSPGGRIVFSGNSSSDDLPVTDDALFAENTGEMGFVGVLDSERQLEYLTFFPFTQANKIIFMPNGNYAVCGYVNSNILPTTANAFQDSFGGIWDGFVAVFSENNQLLYCSYIGGNNEDMMWGLEVDAENNLYISGYTWSSNMYTVGNFADAELDGNSDAFLLKLSAGYEVLWATYFGGAGGDKFTHSSMGSSSELYVVGSTGSPTGIATENAAFPEKGGMTDYMLLKINATSGEISWATYLGGEGNENYHPGMAYDPLSGNVLIGGVTESATNIHVNTEEGTELQGIQDCMLMAFNSAGTPIWSRYFGGTNSDGFKDLLVRNTEVIMIGATLSQSGIAMGVNPLEDEIFLNGQFLAAFSIETGQQQWGTYFNPNSSIAVQSAVIADSEILMAGVLDAQSANQFNPMITPDAIQPYFWGAIDGFFMGIQINIPTNVLSAYDPQPLNLYPNPVSSGQVILGLAGLTNPFNRILIYNTTGKLVSTQTSLSNQPKVDVDNLPNGNYIIKAITSAGIRTGKLVVE